MMDQTYGMGTLSYGRGHSPDGCMSNITGRKNPWHTGFQKKRVPWKKPGLRPLPTLVKVGSGQDESLGVALHKACNHFSVSHCADKNK
jgi:hypothetical protein